MPQDNNQSIFDQVIHIGIDPDSKGGIASVLRAYRDTIPGFHYIPTTSDGTSIQKILLFLSAILRLIKERIWGKSKIIHVHGAGRTSLSRKGIIILFLKLLHFKTIYHLHAHSPEEFQDKKQMRRFYNVFSMCDRVIVLSLSWEKILHNTIGFHNTTIIPNIIQKAISSKNPKNDGIIRLLFLAEISERKGILDLIDVMLDNVQNWKGKVKLTIGGEGSLKKKILKIISPEEINGYISYNGWIGGEKKWQNLLEHDVVILPTYAEGMPITLLEALAYGKTIISTAVGGIPEILDHSNGYLLTPGDKQGLQIAINELLQNPDLLLIKGQVSATKAEPFFPENVLIHLQQLYTELLTEPC